MDPNQPNPPATPSQPVPQPVTPEPLVTAPAPTIINPTVIKPDAAPDSTPELPTPPAPADSAPAPTTPVLTPGPAMPAPSAPPTSPLPATSPEPTPNPTFAPVAAVMSGGDPVPPVPSGTKPPHKAFFIGGGALVVVVFALIFYFGYYTSPSFVYAQSMKNTGKGYDKLIDYLDKQSTLQPKSYTGTGSYKYTSSEDGASDGKMSLKGDGKNLDFSFDAGYGGTRVSADIRAIDAPNADTPDLYVKASGIKSLGSLVGQSQLNAPLAKYDNTWVAIDHTLIDSLNALSGQPKEIKPPTREQVIDEMRAFGKVNQEYVFSTKKDKAVLKVVKTHEPETIDGHKTYHYTVAPRPENIKKYVEAQHEALKSSKLQAWIKENNLEKSVDQGFKEAAESTKDIKTSDTFDVWAEANQRVMYKVRLYGSDNPAKAYVDAGLNYKGGDTYPFFIAGMSKEGDDVTTATFTSSLNTKSNEVEFKAVAKGSGGSNTGSFTANFLYKPSNQAIKVEKPANAVPLAQFLTDFGYGDALSQLQAASAQGSSATGLAAGTNSAAVQNNAALLAAGIAEFVSNNNGILPTSSATVIKAQSVTFSGGSSTASSEVKLKDPIKVAFGSGWPADEQSINIALGSECSSDSAITPSQRSAAMLYKVHSASGSVPKCLSY